MGETPPGGKSQASRNVGEGWGRMFSLFVCLELVKIFVNRVYMLRGQRPRRIPAARRGAAGREQLRGRTLGEGVRGRGLWYSLVETLYIWNLETLYNGNLEFSGPLQTTLSGAWAD